MQEALLYYAEHPYEFVVDVIKTKPTKQQTQVLLDIPKAIKERKGIAVKSGHGTGKTSLQSWIIIWWMTCFPFPKIPCTAPTQHQLYDVLWSELAKWHRQSLVYNLHDWKKTHFFNRKHPDNWFAVAQTSNKPDAMQGFHSEFLLFDIDEASGVPENVFEVIEGTQTEENALILMCGNPTQISGAFYNAFNSKRPFYYCYTFNSEESEIVNPKFCSGIAEKYGKDSDIYRVRVLGEFPKAEPDTLISIDRCEKSIIRELVKPERMFINDVEIGVDVARYGDCESVISIRIGDIIEFARDSLGNICIFNNRDTMFLVGKIVDVIKQWQVKNVIVNIDDSGLGGGVTDRLKEIAKAGMINATINGVNNGGKAKDERFLNIGTEMWFEMREWLLKGKIPNDNDLIAQLSTRKYGINSTGKHIIETKEHMMERGIRSPDRADSIILALYSLIYNIYDRKALYYAT